MVEESHSGFPITPEIESPSTSKESNSYKICVGSTVFFLIPHFLINPYSVIEMDSNNQKTQSHQQLPSDLEQTNNSDQNDNDYSVCRVLLIISKC